MLPTFNHTCFKWLQERSWTFFEPKEILRIRFLFLLESLHNTQFPLFFYQPNLFMYFLYLFSKNTLFLSFRSFTLSQYILNCPYISSIKVGWFFQLYLIFQDFLSFSLLELACSPVVLTFLVSITIWVETPVRTAFKKFIAKVTSTKGLNKIFNSVLETFVYFYSLLACNVNSFQ